MRRTFSALLTLLFMLISAFFAMPTVSAEELSISASAYALFCADSSELIAAENENTKMGIASTTKIMTALIALEQAAACDKEVKFTPEMEAEGSSMYLKAGDVVRLSDLAAGMMMASGNDAANAVALAVSTSFEEFAKLMNNRAKQIGMKNTNFVTPSGLDDSNHYSTAYDMALLMSYAMENDDFRELTAKTSAKVEFVKPEGQIVNYQNHNRLLRLYEPCVGGKTGYTTSCGRCLVTCSEKDGMRLVAVTLNDRNDWEDHIKLYDYGFSEFTAISVGDSSEVYSVNAVGSQQSAVEAKASIKKTAILRKSDADNIERHIYLAPVVFAPVCVNDKVGKEVCLLNGEVVLETDIVAQTSAEYKKASVFERFFNRLFY
ncbi:MAG: D-alanyl-D-alanine carboxypeptidase family protein [Ruminococcus sp.]